MKTKEINPLITIARSLINRRSVLPILHTFLLDSENGRLRLRATDLETALTLTAPDPAGTPFSPRGVDSANLANLVKACGKSFEFAPEGDTFLALNGENGFGATCQTLSANEFPPFPTVTDVNQNNAVISLDVRAAEFVAALRRTSRTISDTQSRPVLSGVALNFNATDLLLSGADGFVLATERLNRAIIAQDTLPPTEHPEKWTPPAVDAEFEFLSQNYIVPGKAVRLLLRLLQKPGEHDTLRIYISPDYIFFALGESSLEKPLPGAYLTTILIPGTYPHVEYVLAGVWPDWPKPTIRPGGQNVRVNTSDLLNVTNAIINLERDTPYFKIEFLDDRLSITNREGSAKWEIAHHGLITLPIVKIKDGQEVENVDSWAHPDNTTIALNARLLQRVLDNSAELGDTITLHQTYYRGPIYVQTDDDPFIQQAVMPLTGLD